MSGRGNGLVIWTMVAMLLVGMLRSFAWDPNCPCPCTLPETKLRPQATLYWRVSVKIIVDEWGNLPSGDFSGGDCGDPNDPNGDLNSYDEIYAAFGRANTILSWYGRGYQFDVFEIEPLYEPNLPDPNGVNCSGTVGCDDPNDPNDPNCHALTSWRDLPARCNAQALADAIKASPSTWKWDDRALNVYVTWAPSSGVGGKLGKISEGGIPVIVGQTLTECNTPFHEICHMFHSDTSPSNFLCHTHGCEFGTNSAACSGGDHNGEPCSDDSDCPDGTCQSSSTIVGDDGVCDTLADNTEWTATDLAAYHGIDICSPLTPAEDVQKFCDTFYNLMSYHTFQYKDDPNDDWDYTFLTQGQLDALTDSSNAILVDLGVSTGRTWFVDAYHSGCASATKTQVGSSAEPFQLLDGALAAAIPGDIILARPGSYPKPSWVIDTPLTLRASKGSVRIGALP